MAGLEVELIEDEARLASIEEEWWKLWRSAGSVIPFNSPAWLIPWWHAFAPGRLFVTAVRSGDDLVGLLPLYLEQGRLGRRLVPLGISISDHFDLLVSPADRDRVCSP